MNIRNAARYCRSLVQAGCLLVLSLTAMADSTAIVNVNVIPMTAESVVADQTVIVTDGIITAIGSVDSIAVPGGATVVDGTDRFLMPGFVEMHAHVTGTGARQLQRLFDLFLANGVTSIRGMLGRPSHLLLRERIANGELAGPRLITSGPSMNGNSVHGAADGARQVREQHAAGYDFIKIHPGLSAAEFNAIADQANTLKMPFAGHVPVSVGVFGAIDKGIATIDHLDGYMPALIPENVDSTGGYGGFFDVMLANDADDRRISMLVETTVAAGVANVATQTLFEQLVSDTSASELANRPEMRYVEAKTVQGWVDAKRQTVTETGFSTEVAAQAISIRRKLLLELHRAGGLLLLGSDAPQIFNVPGFSLHRELALMVAAGLTPYEALQTATTRPASFLGLNAGSVELGKAADLVVLDANPIDDISNSRRVHGVVVSGRWYRASELLPRVR